MDVYAGINQNGINVDMYTGNGTNAQKFKFIEASKMIVISNRWNIFNNISTKWKCKFRCSRWRKNKWNKCRNMESK